MKSLVEQITVLKCPKHESPYCFIYRGELKHDEPRMMCSKCINPKIAMDKLLNIKQAFKLLGDEEIKDDCYYLKAKLWQQFKRGQAQVIKLLECLEYQIGIAIQSIEENIIIEKIKVEYSNSSLTLGRVDNLGQNLDNVIEVNDKGQYQFKEAIQLQQQSRYMTFNRIIQDSMELIMNRSKQLGIISDKVKQNKNKTKKLQEIIMKNDKQQQYEFIQALKLSHYCYGVCFNDDESQIVSVGGNRITILHLLLSGQCIQEELPQQTNLNQNNQGLCKQKQKILSLWVDKRNGKWACDDELINQLPLIYSFCYNHSLTQMAMANQQDGLIRIIGAVDGLANQKVSQQLFGHSGYVFDLCFNHDSTLLASGSVDKLILLWQLNKQKEWILYQSLNGHSAAVWSVKFSKDSTQLISCSEDKSIKIWSVGMNSFWKCEHTLIGHNNTVTTAFWNNQANMIVSGSKDRSIKVWRYNQHHKWVCTQTIDQDIQEIKCILINNDSSLIISCFQDDTIMIHKLKVEE